MTPTWENVSPLVLRTTLEGRTVAVVFRCPRTGERVASRAIMAADNAPGQAVSTIGWQVRSAVANEVARMLGGGLLGQLGRQTVDRGMRPVTTGSRERVFDEQDQRDAIVRAFAEVQGHFVWDGEWVSSRQPAAPFVRQAPFPGHDGARSRLNTDPTADAQGARSAGMGSPSAGASGRPVTSASGGGGAPGKTGPRGDRVEGQAPSDPLGGLDASLVARLLVRVAHADGALDASEQALIHTIADGVGPDAPPPTPAELRAVPTAAREPLWRLAASLAVADGELGSAEQAALAQLAEQWQISAGRRSSLDREAREHAVTLALQEGRGVAEVTSWALRLGVPAARVRALAAG